MKKFLAIYIGSQDALARSRWNEMDEATRNARVSEGIAAWMEWGRENAASIVEMGGPLGKTKEVSAQGIADIRNSMTGYTVIQAESHEAAAKLFENHPHFTIFPGESVEIMECLPIPGQ